ncbi:MAG: hypothetical protein IJY12_05760 [Clostridia bacterium]|nr:hypothetical protein [Clostridia bacterium]
MCEECGYSFLHRAGCPQITDTGNRRCRICDRPVDEEDVYLSSREGRRTAYICCPCLEEMDLYEIKELFGFTETMELITHLTESGNTKVAIRRNEF